jgi:hypothetical protein
MHILLSTHSTGCQLLPAVSSICLRLHAVRYLEQLLQAIDLPHALGSGPAAVTGCMDLMLCSRLCSIYEYNVPCSFTACCCVRPRLQQLLVGRRWPTQCCSMLADICCAPLQLCGNICCGQSCRRKLSPSANPLQLHACACMLCSSAALWKHVL